MIAEIESYGVVVVTMWANLSPQQYASGEWVFMSPCTANGAGPSTNIVGTVGLISKRNQQDMEITRDKTACFKRLAIIIPRTHVLPVCALTSIRAQRFRSLLLLYLHSSQPGLQSAHDNQLTNWPNED